MDLFLYADFFFVFVLKQTFPIPTFKFFVDFVVRKLAKATQKHNEHLEPFENNVIKK